MGTIYRLTDREADILSNTDLSDVIATGPWAKGPMSLAHRAVIREHGNGYVVHTQIVGDTHAYYELGVYIDGPDDGDILRRAFAAFNTKMYLQHNVPTFTRE